MKVLIVSDTHRHNENFVKAVERTAPIDLVVHCGDIEGSELFISQAAGCPVQMVAGNNDFFSELPGELTFKIGALQVWVTHGHHYYVSMGTEFIIEEARVRGVDVVMYGHTHRPSIEYRAGIVALNPGSLSYPRQDGRRPSYIVMETDRFGEWHFDIRYL